MPIYRLSHQLSFPPSEHAEPAGLLAVGADLSPKRLLLAYSSGIFPWYNEGEPILWWSPDPRCVLLPEQLHVSQRLLRTIRQGRFRVTVNRAFRKVVTACATTPRHGHGGTWITAEMLAAYVHLHRLGYAHSVECWADGELAGGIYGVCLGRCFFGESMFHRQTDASKVAFVALVERLCERDFVLLDCQQTTGHLLRFGARDVTRREFLRLMRVGGVMPGVEQEKGAF
ncbi:MAG: leucyl/phenylalanyl-tRNA--protein transferase [Desulfuromonadales bacterium]|nr:leucyl/phenylalanyl-tRNA--protein transferase [Desulfuromonadales bacterium]MDT8422571.1 leucyl/phenylalanyl-tRNA--protein transferase [Desulfuromonadales bacterium]